jgi:hypothetical protein
MKRKSAIWCVAYLLTAALSVGVGGTAQAAKEQAVTMTLQSVALTNFPWSTGYWHTAVFVVTNAGTRPADLSSCGCSAVPTNIPMPLGLFGGCKVPPGTNCAMRVNWKPSAPDSFWVRFAVFEPSSNVEKGTLAARRLRATLTGKANYNKLWESGLWSAAYEITSPIVPWLPEPSPSQDSRADNPDFWSLDTDWSTEVFRSRHPSFSGQPYGAANGSQPFSSETNRTSRAAGSRG